MKHRLRDVLSVMLCVAGAGQGHTALADELSISADTPAVSISTRSGSRNFMQLPGLDYQLTVDFRCTANLTPQSVSLSVADTRTSLTATDLAAGTGQQLAMSIPAGQIPPVRIEGFCLDRSSDEAEDPVEVPAVLSLQGSLLCGDDSQSRVTYASTPLDVLVNCGQAEDSPPEAEQ